MFIACLVHYISYMEKSLTSQKKAPRAERVKASFPVTLDGQNGITRDVSVSGVYLEMPKERDVGTHLQFTIEYQNADRPLQMQLEGEVVRVEKADGRIGLAIKILQQQIVESIINASN